MRINKKYYHYNVVLFLQIVPPLTALAICIANSLASEPEFIITTSESPGGRNVFNLSTNLDLEATNINTSILDVYALNCLQNKPKNLHESISFRYHLYLLTM